MNLVTLGVLGLGYCSAGFSLNSQDGTTASKDTRMHVLQDKPNFHVTCFGADVLPLT